MHTSFIFMFSYAKKCLSETAGADELEVSGLYQSEILKDICLNMEIVVGTQ